MILKNKRLFRDSVQKIKLIYGDKTQTISAKSGEILGDVIARSKFPIEQPCAGRGTCGLCKVLADDGLEEADTTEKEHLSPGETSLGTRLACRAKVKFFSTVVMTPIVIFSNKIFKSSSRYKREKDVPLGLAIDLGTTTVAAYLTMMDNGEVCAGAAALNQQTLFGADVISRMHATSKDGNKDRLQKLALSSIAQAIDGLKLSKSTLERIEVATIVCNPSMHHLIVGLPTKTLEVMPFEPVSTQSIIDGDLPIKKIFPKQTSIKFPALIGGFVGSDALACLVYFGFDKLKSPVVAIDLGTNGEVLVSDGEQILVASTAAGPAFEGVNISCGSRAVDGAITHVSLIDGSLELETIEDDDPIGLTGSGLIQAVEIFNEIGLIENNGRINIKSPHFEKFGILSDNGSQIKITEDGNITLSQLDIRELQKAKSAIRAAIEILMDELKLEPKDIDRFILTGSFGGQIDKSSLINIGMIPPVPEDSIVSIPNGAGYGAAMFLTPKGFALGEELAEKSTQVDMDSNADFMEKFINNLAL